MCGDGGGSGAGSAAAANAAAAAANTTGNASVGFGGTATVGGVTGSFGGSNATGPGGTGVSGSSGPGGSGTGGGAGTASGGSGTGGAGPGAAGGGVGGPGAAPAPVFGGISGPGGIASQLSYNHASPNYGTMTGYGNVFGKTPGGVQAGQSDTAVRNALQETNMRYGFVHGNDPGVAGSDTGKVALGTQSPGINATTVAALNAAFGAAATNQTMTLIHGMSPSEQQAVVSALLASKYGAPGSPAAPAAPAAPGAPGPSPGPGIGAPAPGAPAAPSAPRAAPAPPSPQMMTQASQNPGIAAALGYNATNQSAAAMGWQGRQQQPQDPGGMGQPRYSGGLVDLGRVAQG